MQLLKVNDTTLLDNMYDYIIILDTEGLQSPNQKDHEFDKKIALFTIAVSDIILLNVRGEINNSFKSLIQMCLLSLS
jgi:hypothetical protein